MPEIVLNQHILLTQGAYRRLVNLFFLFLGVVTLVYGVLTVRFYRSWTLADWLVNYQGGFVRRGLPGQVAFVLGRACHCSPVVFILIVWFASYALLLLAGRALALRAAPSFWTLAVLLSPATFSFQVLDANGGFRKEILYLATLAAMLWLTPRLRLSPITSSALLTAVTCVLVLSHEPLACYVPYFFAALVLGGRSPKQSAQETALPLLAALVLAFLSASHHGDLTAASRICTSLGYPLLPQGKQVCAGGAVEFLTFSAAKARSLAWTSIRRDGYIFIYPAGAILSLLPLLAGSILLARNGLKPQVRVVWLVAAVSFLCSITLFVYAGDWGRWIYIHALSLALLLLYLAGRRPQPINNASALSTSPRQRRIALIALVVYATLWSLPHIPGRTLPFGYLGLAWYALLHL